MTPKQAENVLAKRPARVFTRTGSRSLKFIKLERDAVRILAAHNHSQATISNRAHLSLKMFRKALDADPLLRDAFDQGIAEERLKLDKALYKTAQDSKNPRQVSAANSLLKSRHGVTEGGGKSVTVNVSQTLAIPAPQDARKYRAIVKRTEKRTPTLIEHDPQSGPTIRLDPVAAVKAKQERGK